jgi:hypothetical protein
MIATYLIEVTGNKAMPGVWLSLAAGIGLGATLWSGSVKARAQGSTAGGRPPKKATMSGRGSV